MGALLRAGLACGHLSPLVQKLGAQAQHLARGRDGQHVVAEVSHAVAIAHGPELLVQGGHVGVIQFGGVMEA
jgi:hypothetical protein